MPLFRIAKQTNTGLPFWSTLRRWITPKYEPSLSETVYKRIQRKTCTLVLKIKTTEHLSLLSFLGFWSQRLRQCSSSENVLLCHDEDFHKSMSVILPKFHRWRRDLTLSFFAAATVVFTCLQKETHETPPLPPSQNSRIKHPFVKILIEILR